MQLGKHCRWYIGGGKKKWYKDEELKRLCKESQDVRKKWKDEGSIKRGLLYETKLILKRQIKKRVRQCAAREERVRIRRKDKMFRVRRVGGLGPSRKSKVHALGW